MVHSIHQVNPNAPKNSERQAANSKKEKYLSDRWYGLASAEVKENRLTNRAGDLSVIDLHYSRCCQSVI
jgi:hypothetical protein